MLQHFVSLLRGGYISKLVLPRVKQETSLIVSTLRLFTKKNLLQRISTPTELHTYFVLWTINQCRNFSPTGIEKLQTMHWVNTDVTHSSLFSYGILSFNVLSLILSLTYYTYFERLITRTHILSVFAYLLKSQKIVITCLSFACQSFHGRLSFHSKSIKTVFTGE